MNDMRPFKFWSQSVIPLVYDDSLSYYEVLCKIVTYVNGLVENNNEIIKEVGDLTTLVNNFIEESDIPGVVKEELVKMIENGDLDEIIADALEEYEAEITAKVDAVDDKVDAVDDKVDHVFYPVYPTDSVADIRAAIANHSAIKFTEGVYTFPVSEDYDAGITVGSNKTIWLDNAELTVEANSLNAYAVIQIDEASNVRIYGGKITGDKTGHTGTGGEWGDCILVTGGDNIVVEDVILSNGWGDGCEVYRVSNLVIRDCIVNSNRRNGISVISGDKITIDNCKFSGNGGTAPQNGIDIETNNANDALGSVTVINCEFSNTVGDESLNALTHANAKIRIANCYADKGVSLGCSGASVAAVFDMHDCVFRNIKVGTIPVASFVNIDDVKFMNFNGTIAINLAYNSSCYNVYMHNVLLENVTASFLLSGGDIYNSRFAIKMSKCSFESWEGIYHNCDIDLDNVDAVTVSALETVTGIVTRYILNDNTPTNALTFSKLPTGTTVTVINLSSSGKNIINTQGVTRLVQTSLPADYSFDAGTVTKYKRIDSNYILVDIYKS